MLPSSKCECSGPTGPMREVCHKLKGGLPEFICLVPLIWILYNSQIVSKSLLFMFSMLLPARCVGLEN